MITFADRMLVHLSDDSNFNAFLGSANLDAFLTANFQARFNLESLQIVQVTTDTARVSAFEQPTWVETRLMGREEHQGNSKTYIDYKVHGLQTPLWSDAVINLETTWLVDQMPGTIAPSEPATFEGLADLVSVLRINASNHPLQPSGTPLTDFTLNEQGQIEPTLIVDPLNGVLLTPDGSIHAPVQLELFPRIGPDTPLFGAPLGEDGQPLPNLRMNHYGDFTDLAGNPVAHGPLTGLPLDGEGQPVQPARLTIPGAGTVDYRFTFALPVQTERLTFHFITRLHLFILPEVNLVNDLRRALTLQHWLAQRPDYLISLSETDSKKAYIFALLYEESALSGSGLNGAAVRELGEAMNVLIHFFAEP